MAVKEKGNKKEAIKETPKKVNTAASLPKYSIYLFRTQAILLAIIGFIFYANSIPNQYAFDDMMAIVDNTYVQKGFEGIGDIMTHDAYQSYLEHRNGSNQLAGGRYRPLSLITFAIEQQLLGITDEDNANKGNMAADRSPELEKKLVFDMQVRHFINIVLYIISLIFLLQFLRKVVFPDKPIVAFLAVLLFAIHPIHTEVVANVKSRDEILSVLFISLTFIKAFNYKENKKITDIIWACFFYFLALLSKEYAATLLLLVPLSFYIFNKQNIKSSLLSTLPFLIPFALYILLRLPTISYEGAEAEKNIMNNPYFLATGVQKFASEITVLFNYIKLLFIPQPLIADYSYKQIPYTDLTNPLFWLSLLVHLSLLAAMVILIIRKHFAGFAIAFYLINLALVSNIFFNIGAPMGERLIYHSSIGFCMLIAWLLYIGINRINSKKTGATVLVVFMSCLTIIFAYLTMSRNPDWKNNNTLFLTDVKKAPNSFLINVNAGAACMMLAKKVGEGQERKEWFDKAIFYFSKTIEIDPQHYFAYLNRGLCEFNMGYQGKALTDWDTVRKYTPQQVNLDRYLEIASKYFFAMGNKYEQSNQLDSSIYCYKRGVEANPNVGEMWYNLGHNYFIKSNYHDAVLALVNAVKMLPNRPDIKVFYEQVKALDK